MKKISLLSTLLLMCSVLINAQEDTPQDRNAWFDFQIAQSFGLNDWNRIKFASDRLPRTSSFTDLRVAFNVYIVRPVGLFFDMGVGIMPAPCNGLSDPAAQATLFTGIPFYTKEITVEDGYQSATGHFKMTFGLFGKFFATSKLSVSPCLGAGFMTIQAPTCEAVLKEHDSNMQYTALYQWFGQKEYNPNPAVLGYFTGRLRFACEISPKLDLLFGAEYTQFFTRAGFSETYTNYFNHNIVKTKNYEGNRLNMLGLSFGISFWFL